MHLTTRLYIPAYSDQITYYMELSIATILYGTVYSDQSIEKKKT